MTLVLAFAAIFGSLIGSFLNVVIHRLPRGEPMGMERSRCPRCDAQIAWYDNVPVLSYLVLLGRCRRCRAPISFRYPAVELLAALLFALCAERTVSLPWAPGTVAFPVTAGTCAVLLAASFIAWDAGGIPKVLTRRFLPAFGLAGAILVPGLHGTALFGTELSGALKPGLASLLVGLAGAATGAAATALLRAVAGKILGPAGLRRDDVELMGALGLLLGPLGILVALAAGFLGRSLVRVAAVTGGSDRVIPFAPTLAAAGVLLLLYRDPVLAVLLSS